MKNHARNSKKITEYFKDTHNCKRHGYNISHSQHHVIASAITVEGVDGKAVLNKLFHSMIRAQKAVMALANSGASSKNIDRMISQEQVYSAQAAFADFLIILDDYETVEIVAEETNKPKQTVYKAATVDRLKALAQSVNAKVGVAQ